MGATARPGTPPGAPPPPLGARPGRRRPEDAAWSLTAVLGADTDLLEAAAWLHDIGYAPGLAVTGLHALDGARYLRDAQQAAAMLGPAGRTSLLRHRRSRRTRTRRRPEPGVQACAVRVFQRADLL
jgi:hypothetical protein